MRNAVVLCAVLGTILTHPAMAAETSTWKELHRYAVAGTGGWDLLAVDSASRRVFVTRGDHLMVVDIDSGKVVGDVPGLKRAHGVALVPGSQRGYVSSGGDDKVVAFDLATLKPVREITTGKSPDAIVYDDASRHVFVFNGHSNDVTVVDPATDAAVATFAVPGKPELAIADGKGILYVNLEDKNEVARIDTKSQKVLGTWSLVSCDGPTGIALDAAHQRLFSVCANRQMIVVDTSSGKSVATVAIGDGPDGAAFDATSGSAFSSNSDGTLTIVHEDDAAHFRVVATIATPPRSRAIALDDRAHRVVLPFAEFGETPAPSSAEPHPRPTMKANTFGLLIVGQP